RRAPRLEPADHRLRGFGLGGVLREHEPRLDPRALGAMAPRGRQVRAKGADALGIALGRQAPPAESSPARLEQRVGPAPDEPGELLHGPVVLSGAPERLAEPERDFARE